MFVAKLVLIGVLSLMSLFAWAEAGSVKGGAARVDTDEDTAVPLVVGGRTIHVFRAWSGMFTAEERAHSAERRIAEAFRRQGEGWTSIRPKDSGLVVELDAGPGIKPGACPYGDAGS